MPRSRDEAALQLLPALSLRDGEELWCSFFANRTVSAWRAVGGALLLTDQRFYFMPTRPELVFGARPWELPRLAVQRVEVAPRVWWGLWNGGLRRRLRLCAGTREHLFVVDSAPRRASELRGLLGLVEG